MVLTPLRLCGDLDLGADARVDRVQHEDPGAAGHVGFGIGQLRGVAAVGVLHHELGLLESRRFETLHERGAVDGGRVACSAG